MTIIASTALAAADRPLPELAAEAVREALEKCGQRIARTVLLFLSGEFARHAQPAVTAASRAANCLQVLGCTATGVFTEKDWILDRPAAAAMVLAGDAGAVAPAGAGAPAISFAVADRADPDWLAATAARIGVLSSGSTAQEPGRVWCHGKLAEAGRCEAELAGVRAAVGVSRGLRPLGEVLTVTATDGYDLLALDGRPPLDTLLGALTGTATARAAAPLHGALAAVLHGAPEGALAAGRYTAVPVVTTGGDGGGLTLAAKLPVGSRLVWVVRDARVAVRDTQDALERTLGALAGMPDFALMFSCMGRGPYFFGQVDEDLACLKRRLPGVPLVGVYGCGEIATTAARSEILHNSAAIGLFRHDV